MVGVVRLKHKLTLYYMKRRHTPKAVSIDMRKILVGMTI